MTTLGNRIKKRRNELNMTQEELAYKLGYKSKSSINKVENGENDLPQAKIKDFSEALKTTPAYLMGWESEKSQNKYGDHNKNLEYFADKPELLDLYKDIHESESLQLLFDSARDLEPEDLETVLIHIQGIRKARGLD